MLLIKDPYLMKFVAYINVMPHKELLDPQGKTVSNNMKNLQIEGVLDVRIGKHIRMDLEATDLASAEATIEQACQKLLANPIMESYSFRVEAS